MRLFNAIQITLLFSAFPFLVSWLSTGPFPYSKAACVVAGLAYFAQGVWVTTMVYDSLGDK